MTLSSEFPIMTSSAASSFSTISVLLAGRRQAVHLHALPAEPMEVDPHLERYRALARRIQAQETHTVLPCAEAPALLFWARLPSGQITMRKVDGWQTLAEKP